ncbi:MAG: hypothetical protein EOM54_14680 [Clostridia bacterium]|nr:hypothetical protein [Clostridia bacterium]
MRQDEYVNLERFHAWLKETIRSPHYHGDNDNEHWERILSYDLLKRSGCAVFTEHDFTVPASITISGKEEFIRVYREDFIAPEDFIEGAPDEDQEWSTRYTF